MRLLTYEVLLAQAESLARVRALESEIRQAGGKLRFTPVPATNIVAVTLWLPETYHPDQFLPDIPFTPVM